MPGAHDEAGVRDGLELRLRQRQHLAEKQLRKQRVIVVRERQRCKAEEESSVRP